MDDLKFASALTDDKRIDMLPDQDQQLPGSLRTYADQHALKGMRNVEQAVLARVGAAREAKEAATSTSHKLVIEAADALQHYANELALSHTVGGDTATWTDDGVRAQYDRECGLAGRLRALAGTPAAAVADAQPVADEREACAALLESRAQSLFKGGIDYRAVEANHCAYVIRHMRPPLGAQPRAKAQPSSNPGPLAAVERVRLPKLPEELYEHYVSMSAQTHEAHVQAYARAAIAASKGHAS